MNLKKFDRRHIFLIFLILFGIYFLNKVLFPIPWGKIKMTVIKQRGNISDLNTPIDVDFENFFRINTINFPQNSTLKHKNYGEFGFNSNFFLKFETLMKVKRSGLYVFYISSDDGFRLTINGEVVSEYVNNRPFTTTEAYIYLKNGIHRLEIFYFQGYGPCGIVASYKEIEDKRKYLIGKNSPYISFHYVDKE